MRFSKYKLTLRLLVLVFSLVILTVAVWPKPAKQHGQVAGTTTGDPLLLLNKFCDDSESGAQAYNCPTFITNVLAAASAYQSVSGNVAISGNVTTTGNVTASGQVSAGSVKIDNTTFNNIQAGTATLSDSTHPCTDAGGFCTYTVTFNPAFPSSPKIIVTPRVGNRAHTFAVTTANITTSSFDVNIQRVDSASGWTITLQLDWLAWK